MLFDSIKGNNCAAGEDALVIVATFKKSVMILPYLEILCNKDKQKKNGIVGE